MAHATEFGAPTETAGATIGLVCYNVQRAIHRDALRRLVATAPAFAAADLVAIQEAVPGHGTGHILADLAGVLSPAHRWTYAPVMRYPDAGKEYGNGLIHRDEAVVRASTSVRLPPVTRLRWWERAKTEGGAPDTKAALLQVISLHAATVRLATVHLDFAGGWTHRHAQLSRVVAALDDLAPADGTPCGRTVDIICGDFNTVGHHRLPGSRRATRRALAAATDRGFRDATAAIGFTSDLFGSIDPADPSAAWLRRGLRLGLRFRQKTDHVLVRGPVAVTAAGVVTANDADLLAISDHLPLHVTLTLT
ncbi:hypothetical protein GF314_12885 [bacterium]|nr:hypothetical protein [bacterium]